MLLFDSDRSSDDTLEPLTTETIGALDWCLAYATGI
jgi:hypothetical protein